MKKTLSSILILTLLLSLCACSNGDNRGTEPYDSATKTDGSTDSTTESNKTPESMASTTNSGEASGVPESVVLRNIPIGENVTYTITHHYDSASHIDDVEVITYYNGEYGTRTTTYTYAYQHNRSTDLWSLVSGNNGMASDVITLSEEGYRNHCYFSGDFEQAHSGTYTMFVKDLDLTNKTVNIDYTLVFNDDHSVLWDTTTFDLYTTSDGKNLCFVIPYTRSRVVQFELVFVLDIDTGIST